VALYIGVMSGTSMDAVDTALVDLSPPRPELVATHRSPWSSALRERLQRVAAGVAIDATALGRLDAAVGHAIADAVEQLLTLAGFAPGDIGAIGSHGQTVAHAPTGDEAMTLQLGNPHVIAERTGITTISDFRRRDVAAGGQGAPLAPAFHNAVLRSPDEDRAVLNLGGIANLTLLPAASDRAVIGFDSGPANCLMDGWTRRHLDRPFDVNGQWATQGQLAEVLLERLLGDRYFELPPPKSTGTQHFSLRWLDGHLETMGQPFDPVAVQATLLELSARSIAMAIERHMPESARLLVCGGGTGNTALMERLRQLVKRPVETTAPYGIAPEWMETMAFAWLAHETLNARPGNLPDVTGARGPRVLGVICPA
jgi:anhydro-N-acetylmuramic acid kinase